MLIPIASLTGWKGLVLVVIALWLVVALIKRLLKLAVLAAIVLVIVYYVYPFAVAAWKLKL